MMKPIRWRIALAGAMALLLAPVPAHAFQVGGMRTPESFIVDPSTGVYYVSNVNGQPLVKDNNGFIAKLDAEGGLIDARFIQGEKNGVTLHAPKGLTISGNDLYVTDIDVVHRFDKKTGRHLGTIDFKALGARFLNDPATGPGGRVYVSDMLGDTIYRIDPVAHFRVSVLVRSPRLGHPNGLVYDVPHRRLIVVTWATGEILAINEEGKISRLFKGGLKNLDGIDFDREGNLIFSSFTDGKIYRLKNFSRLETIKERIVTPADISFDYKNNRVLIPSFDGDMVFTQPLN